MSKHTDSVIEGYLARDAAARAMGLRGHIIGGGAPDDGDDGDAAGSAGNGGEGGGGGQNDPQPIQLTSAQLEERLQRASRSAVSGFIKELGFEDPDKLRGELQAAKERRDAEMSDLERERARAEAAERDRDEARREAQSTRISQAVIDAAGRAGVPVDRLSAAARLVDISAVEVNEQGQIVGADEAVKAMLDANPFLTANVRQSRGGGADGGASGNGQAASLTADEIEAARLTGVDPARYGEAKKAPESREAQQGYVVGAAQYLAEQAKALAQAAGR